MRPMRIENFTKKYGKQILFVKVGLEIHPGEQIAIIGRNGCGKTTFLKMLLGIERKESGRITWEGESSKMGYVPQENPLLEDMSVEDNLKLWKEKTGKLSEDFLREFDLWEIRKKKVGKLSGGMKRRVTLACAMVNAPGLLILDEPTAALDTTYQEMIHGQMAEYTATGGMILMASHDRYEIDHSTRVYRLEDGKLWEV